MFDPKVGSYDFSDTAARASESLVHLRASRVAELVRSYCAGQLTWAADSFIQLALHRTIQLAEGLASAWNAARILNAAIMARSLIENNAAVFYVVDKAAEHASNGDVRQAHRLLVGGTFASREPQLTESGLPASPNILTQVDRLSKKVFEKRIRKVYDDLSEYLHPNAAGLLMFGRHHHKEPIRLSLAAGVRERDVRLAAMGLHMLPFAETFLEGYKESVRPQLEKLDEELGQDMRAWPGDPSDGIDFDELRREPQE